MSYQATKQSLGLLSGELEARYQAGEPLRVRVRGRPQLRILSLDPLDYERYGAVFNRALPLAGTLAVRGFLTTPDQDSPGALVYAELQVGEDTFGYRVNGSDPKERQVITDLATQVGITGFRLL